METRLRFVVRGIESELALITLLGQLVLDDPDAHAELALKLDAVVDEFNPMFDESGVPLAGSDMGLQPGQFVYEIFAKSNEPSVAHRLVEFLRNGGPSLDAIFFPAELAQQGDI